MVLALFRRFLDVEENIRGDEEDHWTIVIGRRGKAYQAMFAKPSRCTV